MKAKLIPAFFISASLSSYGVTDIGTNVSQTGDLTYSDQVTISGNVTIASNGGNITFSQGIAPTNWLAYSLAINSSGGNISIGGDTSNNSGSPRNNATNHLLTSLAIDSGGGTITLAASGTSRYGAGSNTFTGNVYLANNVEFKAKADNDTQVDGGTGQYWADIINGSGATFNGDLSGAAGTKIFGGYHKDPWSTTRSNQTFQFNDSDISIAGIVARENLMIFNTGATANGTGITEVSSAISGNGTSLTKSGAGTTVFSGINSYTNATIINAGTLQVGKAGVGSLGNTAITVNSGGTLAGTGTIANTSSAISIASGGAISPGDISGGVSSAGKLTTGGITLQSGSAMNYNLGAPTTAGATYDTVTSTGAVTINSSTTLNITAGAGYNTTTSMGGTYTLMSGTSVTGSAGNITMGTGAPTGYAYAAITTTGNSVNLVTVSHAEASWSSSSNMDSGSADLGTFGLNQAGGSNTQTLQAVASGSGELSTLLNLVASGAVEITGDLDKFSINGLTGAGLTNLTLAQLAGILDGSQTASLAAQFLGAGTEGTYSLSLKIKTDSFKDGTMPTLPGAVSTQQLLSGNSLDTNGLSQSGDLVWTWNATVVPEPSAALLGGLGMLLLLRRRRD